MSFDGKIRLDIEVDITRALAKVQELRDTMAQVTKKITINTRDADNSQLKQIESESQGVARAAQNASQAIENTGVASEKAGRLVAAFLKRFLSYYAIIGAARGLAQFTRESVAMGLTLAANERRFTAFSGGVEQATRNIREMRMATRYTLSQFDLMAHTQRVLAMGFAKNADEARRLVTAAILLGDQTKTAEQRIYDFSMMLANTSMRRLDNFGLSVVRTKQLMQELIAAGVPREEAFATASLKVAQEQLEKLGDAAFSTKTAFDQLGAAWNDWRAHAGRDVGELIAPVAKWLADVMLLNDRLQDLHGKTLEDVVTAGGTYDEYIRKYVENYNIVFADEARTREIARRSLIGMTADYEKYNQMVEKAAIQTGEGTRAIHEIYRAFMKGDEALVRLSASGKYAIPVIQQALMVLGGVDLKNFINEFGFLDEVSYNALMHAKDISTAYMDVGANMAGVKESLDDYDDLLTEIVNKRIDVYAQAMLTDALGGERRRFGESIANITERYNATLDEIDTLEEEYKTAGARRRGEIEREIESLRGKLEEYRKDIANLSEEHKRATKSIVFDYIVQQMAVDGLDKRESAALAELGIKWGLIDRETANILANVTGIAEAAAQKPEILFRITNYDEFMKIVSEGITIPVYLSYTGKQQTVPLTPAGTPDNLSRYVKSGAERALAINEGGTVNVTIMTGADPNAVINAINAYTKMVNRR